jgi:NAD(P)-dependent dehydrogenase (short-subunit alcohol dehydrogenase family)
MPTPARFSLEGAKALVTGASGHLGIAIVDALAEAGAELYLNGRNPGPLEAQRDNLRTQGRSAEILLFDVTDRAARRHALQGVTRLDVLVNLAYTGRPGTIAMATPEDFAKAFESGVTAGFELTRECLPALRDAVRARGDASVINIASMYGHVSPDPRLYGESGLNSPPWYGAAKGGLIQLTRYLACHLAPERIRVNAISPGPFPRLEISAEKNDFIERLAQKVPLGRVGAPEEIAGPLLFLASKASSYVTGINLPVDGGWTAW